MAAGGARKIAVRAHQLTLSHVRPPSDHSRFGLSIVVRSVVAFALFFTMAWASLMLPAQLAIEHAAAHATYKTVHNADGTSVVKRFDDSGDELVLHDPDPVSTGALAALLGIIVASGLGALAWPAVRDLRRQPPAIRTVIVQALRSGEPPDDRRLDAATTAIAGQVDRRNRRYRRLAAVAGGAAVIAFVAAIIPNAPSNWLTGIFTLLLALLVAEAAFSACLSCGNPFMADVGLDRLSARLRANDDDVHGQRQSPPDETPSALRPLTRRWNSRQNALGVRGFEPE
jgi:hypothetical protein